ncbi:hypothetical protein RF11_15382 [Thelohanellus kitauei]|uniref:Uncharacterized protein n=1 Tax=Thelohanellus kitauei TaxID=669202 RepID=A0A0C2M7C9_THEKT|nr:hypothetical protein RF11_15382 [Thelohanellus kitauei]
MIKRGVLYLVGWEYYPKITRSPVISRDVPTKRTMKEMLRFRTSYHGCLAKYLLFNMVFERYPLNQKPPKYCYIVEQLLARLSIGSNNLSLTQIYSSYYATSILQTMI